MLNKQWLTRKLMQFYNTNRTDSSKAASEMADILDEYIKSATVVNKGEVLIEPGKITVVGPGGTSNNAYPIIINTVKSKGQIK